MRFRIQLVFDKKPLILLKKKMIDEINKMEKK